MQEFNTYEYEKSINDDVLRMGNVLLRPDYTLGG